MKAILILACFAVTGWLAFSPVLRAMHDESDDASPWSMGRRARLIIPVVAYLAALAGFFAYAVWSQGGAAAR
jgi:hypothetical protein